MLFLNGGEGVTPSVTRVVTGADRRHRSQPESPEQAGARYIRTSSRREWRRETQETEETIETVQTVGK